MYTVVDTRFHAHTWLSAKLPLSPTNSLLTCRYVTNRGLYAHSTPLPPLPLLPRPRPRAEAEPEADVPASSPRSFEILLLASLLPGAELPLPRLPLPRGDTTAGAGGGVRAAASSSPTAAARRSCIARTLPCSAAAFSCSHRRSVADGTGMPSQLTAAAPVAEARQALRSTAALRASRSWSVRRGGSNASAAADEQLDVPSGNASPGSRSARL